ncbi:MAG: SNF2-related protein [Candidatus Binatia bacterium]
MALGTNTGGRGVNGVRVVPTVVRHGGKMQARWSAALSASEDASQVAALARSMPPSAHAVRAPGDRNGEVWAPEALLRAFLDAAIDALVRAARGAPELPAPKLSRRRKAADDDYTPWEQRWRSALEGSDTTFATEGFAERLRKVVSPFLLRRLKSDPTIIADLPPKNEMKVICTLTREQASLYQAVVDEEMRRIESADGIERRGRVLALLTFLKQICNHPAQYLGEAGPLPKRTPPKRGIKMKKTGATWWGQRWIEALERMSRGYSNRLARGRTYARAGRPHDLVAKAGEVTAQVTGSRATPYKVRITLAKLPAAVWTKAIAAMAGKAQFPAELLAGQMPQEIDAAFNEAGGSLFPAKESDLRTSCSCPDWANPCKHVAATHYVLGEALDRDPFLLFELRGRAKNQVLEALRAARAGAGAAAAPPRASNGKEIAADEDEVPSVSLGEVAVADYDTLREPMPALHLSFETPPASAVVLRQLGTPAAWSNDTSPVEMLAPTLRAAAEAARRLALAERETFGEADPDDNEPVRASARMKANLAMAKKGATEKAAPAAGWKQRAGSRKTAKTKTTKLAACSKARRKKGLSPAPTRGSRRRR